MNIQLNNGAYKRPLFLEKRRRKDMNSLNKIKIITAIRYFAESLFFPFISLYFQSIGYSTSQIGILISLIPITAIIMNPIYSHFCKSPKITKNTLMVMGVLEAIFIIGLIFTSEFWLSILLIILISIFSSSNFGLIDSFITLTCDQYEKPFSVVRIFGSASYMVGGFMAGYIAEWTSYPILFGIALVLFIVVSVLYYFIPVPKEVRTKSELIPFKKLFKNKLYIGYVIFYMLMIGTMTVGDDFYSIYLTSKGCADFVYSYVMTGFILVEVITMFLLNRFWNQSILPLYFIGAFVFVVRMILESLPMASIGVLIGAQLSRGITWGIALYVNSVYIKKLLGFQSATKGIMFITLCNSIYTAVFKFFGGTIIEKIGYAAFYGILASIGVLAFVYFIFYFLFVKRINSKPQELSS